MWRMADSVEFSGLPRDFQVDMDKDKDWNRELFSTEKATVLMQIFEEIKPCILKCIFNQYGTTKYEMLQNYCYIYRECRHVIIQHIKSGAFQGYPPSAFSSAVHQYVVHSGLYNDFKWRVVSAFFEYAALNLTDEIKGLGGGQPESPERRHRPTAWGWLWGSQKERYPEVKKSVEQAQRSLVEESRKPGWENPSGYAIDPRLTIEQTREQAWKANENLKEVKDQLNGLVQHLMYKKKVENALPKEVIRDSHEDTVKILELLEQVLQHHDLPTKT